jgi:hypothetical protein
MPKVLSGSLRPKQRLPQVSVRQCRAVWGMAQHIAERADLAQHVERKRIVIDHRTLPLRSQHAGVFVAKQ